MVVQTLQRFSRLDRLCDSLIHRVYAFLFMCIHCHKLIDFNEEEENTYMKYEYERVVNAKMRSF